MPMQPLLNEHDVASLLGLSVETLRQWRKAKKGPAYLQIGRQIRYDFLQLERWARQFEIQPEGAAVAA